MSGSVLVTGASGFIGGALVRRLDAARIAVSALDLGPRPPGLSERVRWVTGSVSDSAAVEQAMEGVDKVVHLAFLMDIEGGQPVQSAHTNVLGTSLVFDAAWRRGVRRVVWGSSVMVYGPRDKYPDGPIDERAEPMPRTPYGATKLALEWMAGSYRRKGLETVALRFTTVFGPGRHRLGAAGFCVTLFEAAASGAAVFVDEGERKANMLYVDDAVQACVKALSAGHALEPVYNIGGFECSVHDLAEVVAAINPRAAIRVGPGGESPWPTRIDSSLAYRDFSYVSRFDARTSGEHYVAALTGAGPESDQSV